MNISNSFLVIFMTISTTALVLAILAFTNKGPQGPQGPQGSSIDKCDPTLDCSFARSCNICAPGIPCQYGPNGKNWCNTVDPPN